MNSPAYPCVSIKIVQKAVYLHFRKLEVVQNSRKYISAIFVTLSSLLLYSCASYAPDDLMLGSSREQIVQILGQPTTELTGPDGKVMMYPRGPFGKHTYFVYLNRDGTMERWAQVLNEKNFGQISPRLNRSDVVATIGESKETFGLARNRGYVWSYRYVNPHCFWFQVEFSAEDIVRSTGYSKSPECRIPRTTIR
jgi:hypothetical protein